MSNGKVEEKNGVRRTIFAVVLYVISMCWSVSYGVVASSASAVRVCVFFRATAWSR